MVESFTLILGQETQFFSHKSNKKQEIINYETKNANYPLDILFLISHGFDRERGSPIADRLV
ncbi:MAG: hypothetical protein F6K17_10475 [Okeania sp. SIO3C4]|nr:hypothetical protein [Okeania sp. SIO3B3]NER03019.1 hypothetical protein [Okeania sp. SIO3C4]